MNDAVASWEAMGTRVRAWDHELFVVDLPASEPAGTDPILILHGFPNSSFTWSNLVERLRRNHRVVLLDMLGYGLSDKPMDTPYSLFAQADLIEAVSRACGLERVSLVMHDMGDSVGGELLARSLDGTLDLEIGARVITNGSIYMDLVQLSVGQQLMLALPDEPLTDEQAPQADLFKPSLAATCSPSHQPDDAWLEAEWQLMAHRDGHRLLPRLIRYVEERRVHEGRWTGAIEKHPSPLTIVWGALDPIAVIAMAERLAEARPDATFVRLEDSGHYPMIEAPDAVVNAILAGV